MKQITAIIADDEENLRMGIGLLLERLWPELKILGQSQNGIEALSLIELEKPDIAFLDIQMPGLFFCKSNNKSGLKLMSSLNLLI